MFGHEMNGVSEAIVSWLEQKQRSNRTLAMVLSLLALSSGTAVFFLMSMPVYGVLFVVSGAFSRSVLWLVPVSLGLTAGIFVRCMKGAQDGPQLVLDPMGLWILKDLCSFGPRLILEGMRQLRCFEQLGQLNVSACARALAYLAEQDAAVTCEDLMRHCTQLPWPRLREQLFLLDGMLFLGDPADRVSLMEPLRVRLRWMLHQEQKAGHGPEPARPRPEPAPRVVPVNDPEKLSACEILGLSASASAAEIRTAYRKRVKECHPDLFAGMDQQSKALAERWTRALNAAYATLNPRRGGTDGRPQH